MRRKILSSLFALVLLAGLSLMPAVPAAADGPPPPPAKAYAGYEFGKTGSNTAEWSTADNYTGPYSVKLYWADTANAYVEFIPQTGITMSDLDSIVEEWSFWYKIDALAAGPNMELQFTSADYPTTGFGHAEVNVQVVPGYTTDVWAKEDAVANPQVYTYYYVPSDGTEGEVGRSGDPDYPLTLATTLAAIDADDEMVADGASAATWELTRVRMEIGWGAPTRTCYIDDVTIDGVTYAIEPMVLDAEYYKTGDTVSVTVCSGNASGTIGIFAKSDTVGEGGKITIALSETGTGTGVFEGSFKLVDTTPGTGELLVNNGDSVDVYYQGHWGAGLVILAFADPPSATVDDTAPVITNLAPADSANITENKPTISADYSDVGSAVDNATAVMKVDTVAVTANVTTTSEVIYYPSANLTEGSHTVTVDVDDMAGNAATQASWSFTVDTIDPAITGQAADPTVIPPDVKTLVVFTANVTDATSGVKTVKINLSLVGGGTAVAMLDADADGIYTASANITETDKDDYDLPVTAKDIALNEATENITLGVWSDIVDPVITGPAIIYPFVGVDSAMPTDNVTISANVTDDILMGTVMAACTAFETTVSLTKGVGDIYTGTATVKSDAGWDDYTITITAEDAVGNDAIDTSLELAVRSGATGVEIDLVEGWNLISLPLIPDSSNIMVVISADTLASENVSNVGIVYSYDPATGLFEYYMPATGSGDLTTMEDGAGYWVFMNADDTLAITGAQWPTPPAVPPSYGVVVGWNLIGFKSLVDLADTGYLISLHFYEDYDPYPVLWSYDAVAGAYENVKGGTMEVGHGFWLWMTEAMVIVPPE